MNRVTEIANEFVKNYNAKRIFIPKPAAEKVDAISRDVRLAHREFTYGIINDSLDLKDWIEIVDKVDKIGKSAMADLEDDFRKLLGEKVL